MFTGKLSAIKASFHSVSTILLVVSFVLVSSLILFSPYIPKNVSLTAGDSALETIVSPHYLEFESTRDAKINQDKVASVKKRIGIVYSINKKINREIIENIDLFFDELRSNSMDTMGIHITQVLPESDIKHLKSLSSMALKTLQPSCVNSIRLLLKDGLKTRNESLIRSHLFSSLKTDAQTKDVLLKVVLHYIKPNLTVDQEQTNLIIAQALSSINYQKTIYKESQPIIYASELVTDFHIEVFKKLNIYNRKASFIRFFGILFCMIFSVLFLHRFIQTFNQKISQIKYFLLLYLVMLLLIGVSRFVVGLQILPANILAYLLIPIPISAMLLSILVTPNLSLITGTLLSFLIALMFQFSFDVFLFLFLTTCITTFTVIKTVKRSELILSGYTVGGFNIAFVLCIGFLQEQSALTWYVFNAVFGFGNGVISAMIALAILPYFESLFSLTTNQTLLELSNLNHPLLKRLMLNTPGSYQHSLMVANMSEAAAEAIQANTILCRVGSYFHDIGKLKRPLFFTENQFSEENPHKTISPRMSKMIIISHVKDGHEMALKHKLPVSICDIILQHHGTSLLSVFYTQAIIQENTENTASDDEFRYPGPKPQTKEAGIIMLADSVEAATRSLAKPSLQKIEGMVDKIFKSKLDDEQLSECPLSLNEIFLIKNTFLNLYKGLTHSRVDYQKEIQTLEDSQREQDKGTADS